MSASAIGCRIDKTLEGGDHWMVVGGGLALYRTPCASPLVFFGGHCAMNGQEILVSRFQAQYAY